MNDDLKKRIVKEPIMHRGMVLQPGDEVELNEAQQKHFKDALHPEGYRGRVADTGKSEDGKLTTEDAKPTHRK